MLIVALYMDMVKSEGVSLPSVYLHTQTGSLQVITSGTYVTEYFGDKEFYHHCLKLLCISKMKIL